ncbi:hypothetical protein H4CHR_01572 [Variovorax sp. PBS-H4]|uniref:hypothetical protein n=1 Tax=Variovorax sp. PBS-H4 TaxID=434008 RepID=UPI0013191940|nr:hypothetical protein [Variovorax sp. PBS-H4]VTU25328.1 hypothetical protein H4CHR_01572 [Variovorax sp. PBS-H4]
MAEVNVTRTKLAQVAGTKSPAATYNGAKAIVIETPAAYAAPAQNDIAGTEIYLRKGDRVLAPVTVSCAAGTASSTLSVGIRDAVTKVAVDATALVNAAAINAAATAQFNTGTKLISGQTYLMPQDVEIYLTFGGAVGTANQAIRVELEVVAP